MSSTTRTRRRDLGQVLVIFAFGLVAIMAITAIVFDAGQNLFDRRKEQDAADAAALAGARWLTQTTPDCKGNPNLTTCKDARDAAVAVAVQHGFAASQVKVSIPPTSESTFAGAKGYIQVVIDENRSSFFSGVLGMTSFRVAALAVAANTDGYSLPYSFLSLDPTGCGAGAIGGNGSVTVGGSIQVNSTCPNGALSVNGGGSTLTSVTAGACNVVGDEKTNGGAGVDCGPGGINEGAPSVPDPLEGLGVDLSSVPDATTPNVLAPSGSLGPSDLKGCPGRPQAGTKMSPAKCQVSFIGNGSLTTIVLHPGVYWGGLDVTKPGNGKTLNIYLLPGIYALAGGGFSPSGSGSGTFNLITVDSPATIPTFGGGILFYNTDDPFTCPVGNGGCIGAITVTGGAGALELKPYQDDPYKNLLLYQDRDASAQPDIKISGQGTFNVEGTIYAPKAEVLISGNGSGISAQVISFDFQITGNGGINVTYNANGVFQLKGAGLVQ